jgi:diadenylate cyclase
MEGVKDFLLLVADQLSDPREILDILLLWLIVYQVVLLMRRTRAVQMFYGVLIIVALWLVTGEFGPLRLQAVNYVLSQVLIYGAFVIIVIFQNPIRQALAQFGRYPFLRFWQSPDSSDQGIEEIALACSSMASRRIGALIVFERVQGLRNYVETGIELDAKISYDLLLNIFSPRTPLHDGAVIIGSGKIKGASCFLPLTVDPYISRQFGTRHRAGIGITEETDAIAVIVSEERGTISVAIDGALSQDLDTRSLRSSLEDHLKGERFPVETDVLGNTATSSGVRP